MQQKDYSTRYFKKFGEVLTQLFFFKKRGSLYDADELLRESFNRFLSIYPEVFDDILAHRIMDYVLAHYTYNTSQFSVLAELLKERGELSYLRGDIPFFLFNYQLALNILEFVNHEETNYSIERMEKIYWLQHQVSLFVNDMH